MPGEIRDALMNVLIFPFDGFNVGELPARCDRFLARGGTELGGRAMTVVMADDVALWLPELSVSQSVTMDENTVC